jgi:RNA-directed DNA polymerase
VEPSQTGKQKTAQAGASVDTWPKRWKKIGHEVRRLQGRIAKAVTEGRWAKVKVLTHLLTRSLAAKSLAVRRVTSNKGRRTPGIDGIIWKDAKDKINAVLRLQRRGYHPKPLRRIYIPKKNGKKRPLSIPTMIDRAMQALYALALAPIAETLADRNSYGFREGRSCADAIAAVFNALSKPNSATWVLEGDIEGCYDNISHEWLVNHIPMDREILRKWLKVGYIEERLFYPTHKGTPQGGIVSPLLANMTLDGLEKAILQSVPRRSRVNFIRYADDFVVTGKSQKLLETTVIPTIEEFLAQRGLRLSPEKTKITYITEGFSFLGQDIRKFGRKLIITPNRQGVITLIRTLGDLIRRHTSAPMDVLITKLNALLRGWANYHRHVAASRAFRRVDSYVYDHLWRMLHRRHGNKSTGWLSKKYWSVGRKSGCAWIKKQKTGNRLYRVLRVCSLKIVRHVKIKADANPYLAEYATYFQDRRTRKEARELGALSARLFRAQMAS